MTPEKPVPEPTEEDCEKAAPMVLSIARLLLSRPNPASPFIIESIRIAAIALAQRGREEREKAAKVLDGLMQECREAFHASESQTGRTVWLIKIEMFEVGAAAIRSGGRE